MKWKSIAALLFLCNLAVTVPIASVSYAASPPSYTAVTQAVQAYVQKDAAARNFNLLSVQISAPQVQQTGTTATLKYIVTTTHTLNFASADASPVVKGISRFLANNPKLSVAARTAGQTLLASWKTRIQGYIDNPLTSNEDIEATASVDSAGNVIPGTIKLFFENPDGSLIPEARALADIPSNATVQSRFEANPTGLATGLTEPPSASPDTCSPGPCPPYNAYNAQNAVTYALTYVCQQGPCGTNIGGTTCNEYPSSYNLSYWYSGEYGATPVCNDCSNFVSQSMYAGGIPTSATWNENEPSSGNRVPGTTAWTEVNPLVTYMTTNGGTAGTPYWQQLASMSYVVEGDTVVWPSEHTMIATGGDGTTAYFTGHTNDDYQVGVDPNIGETPVFYNVSDMMN